MAILPIVKYPDKRLKTKSQKVREFDEGLHTLLDDMYETMIATNGIGLAAIQVNKPICALVITLPREEDGQQYEEDRLELINPILLKTQGIVTYQEGCLSVPGFYEEIERFESVSIGYQDRFGVERVLQADGLLAIAVQHEMDHLDGVLFVDRLPILRRKKFEKELKRIQKEQKSKTQTR